MEWLITVPVCAYVCWHALKDLRGNLAVIRQYRLVPLLQSLAMFAVLLTTWTFLAKIPFLAVNPLLWVLKTAGAVDKARRGNIIVSGIDHRWYGLFFLPVFALALPSLARIEEKLFREGTRDWRSGIARSIAFGLTHLIMLIPTGAALALTIPGLWLTHQYFRGGVERSTVYHALFNTVLVALLFVGLLIR